MLPLLKHKQTLTVSNERMSHLRVEDVQNGGTIGDTVEQHGEGDGADHDDATVLGAIYLVRRGVAAVLRGRQQRIPVPFKV